MKFEIDDKTGMIVELVGDHKIDGSYSPPLDDDIQIKVDLEQILQAVKKTQKKLVNKQIQEIQDSKNHKLCVGENVQILGVPNTKTIITKEGKFIKLSPEIEQNQKIVDIVQKWYDQVLDDLSMIVNQGGKDYDMLNLQNKLCAILEGKDIKDL